MTSIDRIKARLEGTMLMTELERLTRAMIREPTDDLVRLAIADEMEEQQINERLVATIRRQVADPALVVFCHEDLDAGQMCLVSSPCEACKFMREVVGVRSHFLHGEGRYRMRRGFLEMVRCEIAVWKFLGKDIARTHPVTFVDLIGKRPVNVKRKAGGSRTYAWFKETAQSGERHNVSDWLFPEGKRRVNSPTEHAARAKLSEWCLDWARKET